jgi:cytochrome c553
MLGSDRSRGYGLEMICADFLAGANLDHGDQEMQLFPMTGFFKFLPREQRQHFLSCLDQKVLVTEKMVPKRPRLRLDPHSYKELCRQVLARDNWRCQLCGSRNNLQVHHQQLRSQQGSDEDFNLITLCAECHAQLHGGNSENYRLKPMQ